MKRVLVIGCGGAGKSTFAARLGAKLGLPVVHLDALYWQPGWVKTPEAEWQAVVEGLLRREAWVMDGNYGGTMDLRLAACDAVVFLDLPRWLCLWRVVKRRLAFHNRSRPDMTEGCPERLSWEFLAWVWSYRRGRRPRVLERLAEMRPEQRVIVLRTREAVERYLATVEG